MLTEKLGEIKDKLEKIQQKVSQKIIKQITLNWQQEKTYSKCYFYLTGFGKFGNHLTNPTTHILNYLKSQQLNQEEQPFIINDLRVLEVTATACRNYYEDVIQMMNNQKQIEQQQPLNIIIHFGLYSGAGQFQLESIGKNDADFGIPDMEGIQYNEQKICKDFPRTHKFKTTLPVEYLTERIYISLFNSLIQNYHSLFVHVPEFTEIDEETQYQFAVKLLDEIYQYYAQYIVKKDIISSSS